MIASGLNVAHGYGKPRAEDKAKMEGYSLATNATSGILSSYTAKGVHLLAKKIDNG